MKKWSILLIASCLLQSAAFAQPFKEILTAAQKQPHYKILKQFLQPRTGHVQVVAHRGDWRNAPENTVDAIRRCIDMGVDIVEIDVRQTKDGHLVVIHDKTIDRTTTGKGKVEALPLDTIRKFRLRQANGVPVPGVLPTLREVLEYVKGKPVLLNLDKAWDYLPDAYKLLKETGTLSQAIFKGNETLSQLREKHGTLLDSILYMPMVWPMDYNIYGSTAAEPDVYIAGFYNNGFQPAAFEMIFDKEQSPVLGKALPAIRQKGTTVWVNTLWDELCGGHSDEYAILAPDQHWGWIIQKGVHVIQTDRPRELLDYLKSKGLR